MKAHTNRRRFLGLLPLAAAGAAAAQAPVIPPRSAPDAAPAPTGRQGQGPQQPLRVKKESMHAAEELMGLELTDAQETMALRGVDNNLTGYENLRKINVPLDTDPAMWFHPTPPSKKLLATPKQFVPTVAKLPSFKSPENLAFATALELGALIRAR